MERLYVRRASVCLMAMASAPGFASDRVGETEIARWRDLDERLYDLPLTLKTCVPSEWSGVEVRQGGRIKRGKVARESGRSWATYQAVPNAEAVMLTRAGS